MPISQIAYEDLMQECNIDDVKIFRKILKNIGFKHISPNKLVSKDLAEDIVKKLIGKQIDWYKYENRERDLVEPGVLKQKDELVDGNLLEEWFTKIVQDRNNVLASRNYLLGLVCKGGFLGDTSLSDFSISLKPGMNILIGDRGSGKSTILNLLGVLSNSMSEETSVLIDKLLNLFRVSTNEISDFNRKIYRVMRGYSLKECAIFFALMGECYCYFITLKDRSFDLLKRKNAEWHSTKILDSPAFPSIHYLPQGEVTKISEEKNTFYLHHILDNLYPDLYRERMLFAQQTKYLVTQFQYHKTKYLSFNKSEVERFVDRKFRELNIIQKDVQKGNLTDTSINILRIYINNFYGMNRSILPKSTFELLKGDENSFLYLYVGRIIKFLSESVRKIDQLKEKQNLENTNMLNEDDLSEEAQTSFDDTNTSEFVGEVAGELVLEEIEKTEDEENQRLFLEALLAMESPLNKKILGLMKTVLQFLWARLRVMRVCISIYAGDHVDFAGSFKALSESYSSLLKFRISLLTSQKRKCEITTQTLNKGEMGINIYTKEADQIIHKHQNSIQKISEISSLFEEILQFNPQNKMRELYDLVENYDLRTRYILDKVFSLSKQETQNMFFFSPVEVELRQGKGYRAFHQLSFGQKSGIILKMVLMIPSKHVIIIDQPEDNLDVASIVNMLAPTLQELAKDHQVVIATHSSNLVMGLSGGDLVVLESIGDYGRIKERGSLFKDRQVIREMLDILEGGAETINQKMELYEKFISRVKGAIEDIDIMTIESSFRRRTIDELRNFLQPIISDKALLDFVRHELNQSDYIRIQQNIHDTKQETLLVQCSPDQPLDSLFTKLNKLCTELDKHIIKLKGIIEEIRLMDTQPNFTYVDIYLLLIILRNDYIDKMFGSKFGRKVDITIDSSFQGVLVYADYDHLRLIFRNLLNNALRATESRAIAMKKKSGETLVESIIIEGVINSTNRLVLKFKDNGCGMALEIRKKLYLERCSTKKFGDHGLGGIIIKKLLNINHGSIQILESNQNGSLVGTEQEISLLIHITDLPVK